MAFEVVQGWADSLSMPIQNFTIAVILFSAYPLAYIYSYIPSTLPTAKHLFSILLTITLCLTLVDPWLYVQLLSACLVAYTVVSISRESVWAPVSVFLGMMAFLSVHHLENQIFNPDSGVADNTAPIMMMVIKMSTFAWAAHDGTKKDTLLSREQQRTAIRTMPNLIEFLGYAFFFGGWFVGPANDFIEYRRFTRGEPPFDKIPPRGLPAFKTLLVGLFTIGIYMKFSEPLSHYGAITPEFMKQPFWFRLLYINLAGNVVRCKYYGAWKLAEGACIISGIGYLGPCPRNPTKMLFSRVQNADPLRLELAQSPREYIGAWNQQTGKWLRECVYLRLAPQHTPAKSTDNARSKHQKPKEKGKAIALANVGTYFTSAFWHGFRPGYYFTFLSGAMVTITGQLLRRNLRPLVTQPSRLATYKPLYDFVGWLGTQISINYICAPFPVYTIPNGIQVWKSVYFMVHIWNVAALVAFGILGGGKLCRRIGELVGADYHGHKHLGTVGKVEVEKSVRDSADVFVTGEDEEVKDVKDHDNDLKKDN